MKFHATHTVIICPDSDTLSMRSHLSHVPVHNKAGVFVLTSNVNVQFLVECWSRSSQSSNQSVVGMSVFLWFFTVGKVDLYDLVLKCYRSFLGCHGEFGQSGNEEVYVCLIPGETSI